MKNPFRFFRSDKKSPEKPMPAVPEVPAEEEPATTSVSLPEPSEPDDGFVEWLRTRQHGGIERRERNDIFEAYTVYGVDQNGSLTCRLFHRYPEHEKEFGMSYSRALGFDDFNKRLLSELDRGYIDLCGYNACIQQAEALPAVTPSFDSPYSGFHESEISALRGFCESADTLTDKEYRTSDGVFRCSCRSIVGDESLNLWFRRPLPHDALYMDISGVGRTAVAGYDLESMWIMGIYNRLAGRCKSVSVTLLTDEWSLSRETICLMTLKDFDVVDGTLLLAVSDVSAFPRFGFYSLDFSKNAN